ERHENLQRLVLDILAAQGKEGFQNVIRIAPAGSGFRQFRVVLAMWMMDEQVPPHFQTAGNRGVSVRVEAETRGQQQHVAVSAKYRSSRSRAGYSAADRRVKTLQARRLRQIILHRSTDAQQRVEIAGQPAIVFSDEMVEERRSILRAGAGKLAPRALGTGPARHHCMAVAELEHRSVKVEHVRIQTQLLRRL